MSLSAPHFAVGSLAALSRTLAAAARHPASSTTEPATPAQEARNVPPADVEVPNGATHG